MAFNFFKKMVSHLIARFKEADNRLFPGQDIKVYADRIISDGILLNELPSPSEQEEIRGEFIKRRLTEFDIETIHTDEFGNIFVLFPTSTFSDKYLLVHSDMDNMKYSAADSIVEVRANQLTGIGIGDNSIGASALLVLCEYIKKNNLTFDINLVMLFSLRNTPEYGFRGIQFFLDKWSKKIACSVYIFGLYLGRLVAESYGVYNISFLLKSNQAYTLEQDFKNSTVDLAVHLYNEINAVDWSTHDAIVNIVRVSAGVGFEYFPLEGIIDIEIFSKNIQSLHFAKFLIDEIAYEVSKDRNVSIRTETVSYLPPAVDEINSKMHAIIRNIHKSLNIETQMYHIPDYTSLLNHLQIPSITLGITTGKKTVNHEEIDSRNIANGFRQVLLFIDELAETLAEA